MPRNANQSKQANYSLDFGGSSDISISSISVAGEFTLSAWVKGITSSNFYIFGSTNTSNWFRIQGGNAVNLKVGGGQLNDSSPNTIPTFTFNSTDWYYIVATRDSSNNIQVYVNGSVDSSYTPRNTATPLNANFVPNFIGRNQAQYTTGKLDAVSIFDYAVSASQVTTLWGGGTSVSNPMALPNPPKAYYPLGTSAWNGNFLAENNAIGDYVFDFPALDAVQSDFTLFNGASEACISAWFKTSTQQNGKCLFSSPFSTGGNRFDLYLQTNGFSSYLKLGAAGATNISSSTINYYDDKWHNVIVTYDGVNHKIYYDGNEVATAARSGALATSTYNKLEIGRYGTSYSNNVVAEISNVLVWTKGLTPTEAETLYNYGSPIRTLANIPQSSNLKVWYKLDASDVYDSSTTEWNNIEARANNKGSMLCGYNSWSGNALLQSYNSPVERSISIWVRRTASMGYHGCCNQQGTGGAQAYSQFFVWSNRGYIFSFFVPSPNKFVDFGYMAPETWYHAVLTDTGVTAAGRFKTYWNGEFANASTDLTYDLGTPVNGFKWAGGNFLFAGGSIADGRLFDTVLSASEVQTLYNNGAPSTLNNVKPSNLKQWLTFENIDTSVGGGLYDKSGNDNQVTTPLYPWVAAKAAENLNVPISSLNGLSSGMSQSNLVQSDLQTVAPYSKYAMSFNGTDYIEVDSTAPLFNGATSLSISAWCNIDNNVEEPICSIWGSAGNRQYLLRSNTSYGIQFYLQGSWGMQSEGTASALTPGQWYHVVATWDGSFIYIYVNGSLAITPKAASGTLDTMTGQKDWIGRHSANYLDGNLSNVAYWKNTALNESQVREVYNQGLPGNLNTFSGTAPTSWLQLGENSSYSSGWTFADEMPAGNNGTGYGLAETDLTNGVGTTANGTSTGMGVGALVSDAPYSTGNAMSVNMAATARGTDVP